MASFGTVASALSQLDSQAGHHILKLMCWAHAKGKTTLWQSRQVDYRFQR